LSAPSAHARLSDGADLDLIFETAATVGVQTVIHPFSPRRRVRGHRHRIWLRDGLAHR
jgi:hypothetical protein